MSPCHRGRIGHSASNDIRRGEKTAERTAKHTGRDDRATSEQVIASFIGLEALSYVFTLTNHNMLLALSLTS